MTDQERLCYVRLMLEELMGYEYCADGIVKYLETRFTDNQIERLKQKAKDLTIVRNLYDNP